MKLPDFHNSGLSDIRIKIGAELVNYKSISWIPRETEIISVTSDTIKINGIDNTITNNEGERIVVYIRDVIPFKGKYNDPRIHFYNCSTIKEKIEKNNFDSRYIGAYTKSGLLRINLMGKDKESIEESLEKKLEVCYNCLRDAKSDKEIDNELLEPFNLTKYFDFYEYYRNRVKSPKYNFLIIIKNQYPKNWEEISKHERQKVNYKCQDCGKDCINNKYDLHVHHKDHNKGNNFSDNFEVLCYNCHAKHHPHMLK